MTPAPARVYRVARPTKLRQTLFLCSPGPGKVCEMSPVEDVVAVKTLNIHYVGTTGQR
jgi:hypothetical protein